MDNDEIKFEPLPLFENRFLNAYDLNYAPGKHYFEASRRSADKLVATMSDDEFKAMLPDAVTCAVIIRSHDDNGREREGLLLSYEYRYPCGRFLLSPPAGLIDPEDAEGRSTDEAVLMAAAREIKEETGLGVCAGRGDRLFTVSPVLFSSPGMTDESNAIACAVLNIPRGEALNVNYDGITGTERFAGSIVVDRAGAEKLLKKGRDAKGNFYSAYTAVVLLYFISGLWRSE
ncbi:MAG: NUDIX hydrolase [Clostridia bacterium]|nr:NUDIX hydrolase [Clostridia bacterium]